MSTLCDHGYFMHDCALCLKRPGECDYGSCTEPATDRTQTIAHGRVCEIRPMCATHATRIGAYVLSGRQPTI